MKTNLLRKIRKYYLVKYNVERKYYFNSTDEPISIKEHVLLNIFTKEVVLTHNCLDSVIKQILRNISDRLATKYQYKKDKINKRRNFEQYINLDVPQKF